MARNLLGSKTWISAVLAFLMVFTTLLPFGAGVAQAAGGLQFIGISNSTSPTNPHIHYSSTIDIQGTYPTNVDGNDLRYQVTSLSGSQPSDTSSIKPSSIDPATRTFTFRNISLIPGVNVIAFSFKNGDSNTDLSKVYVQYSNTPMFSDLRLDSVLMESDLTIVEVNTPRNTTLRLSGKAPNADSVVVTNKTTGKTFTDYIKRASNTFSVEVETQIGLNEMDIHAYSSNKEVALVNRSVLVIPKSNAEGASDQFYDVKITGPVDPNPTRIEQIPPARTEVVQDSGSGEFVISGKLLVKVQDGATILDKYQKDITPPDAPVGLKAVTDSVATTVEGIVEADATVIVKKGNNELGRIQAGSKGEFKFDLNAVQPIGTSLSVTAVDEDKNSSSPSTVIVTEKPDDEKPENPDVAAFDVTTATLTGNAEAGSTVKVMVGNRLLGTDVTLPSGIFSVILSPGPLPGTTLTVTATDAAGNISDPTAFTISGGPVTRTIVTPEVDAVTNKDTKVTGIAEAHTFIEVYNGNTLLNKNEVQAGDDGKFEVEISSPQPANTRLTVKANDGAGGNSSNEAVVIVRVAPTTPPVTAVPAKPSVTASVSNKDTDISVKITDGSTSSISVKKGAKVLGTKPVTGAGTYVVNIAPVANGDKLSVIATNAKGDSDKAEVVSVVSNSTLAFTLNRLDQNEEISLDLTYEEDEKSILPSGYKIYNIEGATSSSLQSDGVYEMQIGYQTLRQNADNLSNIVNDVIVQNHRYQFVYKSTDVPRFGKVTNVSHPEAGTNTETRIPVKTDGSVNVVNILPAKFEIETFKMGTLPKSSDFAVYFNNSETKLNDGSDSKLKQDYVFSSKSGSITLEFRNLPASETTVKVKYLDDKEISFKVKPEVAPSLLFYYTASRDEKVIDSSLEITDSDPNNFVMDGGVFHGKLYNVSSTKIEVRLNGQKIDNPFYSGPTRNASDNVVWFEIHKDKFLTDKKEWNLKQGNNSLVFSLTDDPRVNFTYNIIYNTEKTPKIEDVTLKVVENKGETELAKKSSDAAYRTSALFLTEFSFKATNVDEGAIATITKDGNVIAKYKLNDKSGNWEFLNDADFKKSRDAAIKGNTRNLGAIFDSTTFSKGNNIRNKFTFTAEMDTDEYGRELVEELSDGMGLTGEELENRLKLFPMTLAKGGTTNYQIEIIQGSVATRHNISITQDAQAWTVISPTKLENAQYITVNSNSVPIKIFAEKATKVLFGKTEAVAYNTDFPDYKYDSDTGKLIPETYYVFESNVTLKPGLNTIKFTVQFGSNSYNDEIKIFNLNSAVGGAESRDVFGKKLSFSVFEKAFELKFPSGTVLLAPQSNKAGSEVNAPQTDIFTNVPIYFGIADRTNGQVSIDDHGLKREMEDLLRISSDFNYASPLYFVDAGNAKHGSMDEDEDRAPGGRDPYYDGTVNNVKMEPFIERWRYNLVPSKVGTVTIKYDPSIVNAANNILTVFYNNGDEWINLGGVVNTSKKTVTVPFKGFGYYMVMKTRETFSDVINHPFARDAIETLYAKGIMNDAPGSGFGTELKISRGEFATMLVKALDLPINAGPYSGNSERNPTEPSFNDVHPDFDDWNYEYKYIETAARAGIVRGKSTRGFFPDDPLTREEATIMIARALNLKLGNADAAMLALGKSFTDGQQTGYYAAPSVLAVTKAKIMNGEVNDPSAKKPTYRFNPKGDLTRAEMAIITIRIMTQLKKLPK